MKPNELKRALAVAVEAAQAAGDLMRRNLRQPKRVLSTTRHDIKLELDVRCQKLIERRLLAAFPQTALLGEEGVAGAQSSPWRWVVDPIDGTVNFTYGIPHAAVSIALEGRTEVVPAGTRRRASSVRRGDGSEYTACVGVVYDPFCDELWTARRGEPARLNGRRIQVSKRRRLTETVVAVGFGNKAGALNHLLPTFTALIHRVLKLRLTGSAALSLTYVATGRFDAFVEAGLRLWDIAAGGLIVECAGGEAWRRTLPGEHVFLLNANNGHLRRALERVAGESQEQPE